MTKRCDRCGAPFKGNLRAYEVGPQVLCGPCFDKLCAQIYEDP